MYTKLHKNATTTPRIRAEIQAAPTEVSDSALARYYNVSSSTIKRWRHRSNTHDYARKKPVANQLLSPFQEKLLIDLRVFLRLSLDELVALSNNRLEINVSRASIHRLLKSHGVSRIKNVADQDFKRLLGIEARRVGDCICEQLIIKTFPLECNVEHANASFMLAATNSKRTWRYMEIGRWHAINNEKNWLSTMLANSPFAVSTVLKCDGQVVLSNRCECQE